MHRQYISLFIFRNDLRLRDNPGLYHACNQGPVIPIYIIDSSFHLGGASLLWLKHGLEDLAKKIPLTIYSGDSVEIIKNLCSELKINAICISKSYDPFTRFVDQKIKKFTSENGIDLHILPSSLLWEPENILTKHDIPYRVFTPFKKIALTYPVRKIVPDIVSANFIKAPNGNHTFLDHKWHYKILEHWNIGESCALDRLEEFIASGLHGYKEGRNYPAQNNVSRLSPYLHFGHISPTQIWHRLSNIENKDVEHFISEVIWREFSYYLLWHFPDLPHENFNRQFNKFQWGYDKERFELWKKGMTGFPIVDAGMRELWQTGYMHNRVRMIVASFLVKNLHIHWHYGADWFWDCLLDADIANNSASWQWVAGSGADAAPYFRIFNPVLQGEKHDPDGEYTKRFVPELKDVDPKILFDPTARHKNYPAPMIDLKKSREETLEMYKDLKN